MGSEMCIRDSAHPDATLAEFQTGPPGTPFHASPRAPSCWPTPAQTRLWPNFKQVHPILDIHPPIGYPISITPTRLWPGYLYALHIFTSERIRQLKNYIIVAPPQHDTLRCFLDVDSFQRGSFNLSENISDLISFMFYCLILLRAGVYLVFCWLQWLQCVDRC